MSKAHRRASYLKYAPLLLTSLGRLQNYYLLFSILYPMITKLRNNSKTIEHNLQKKVKRGPIQSVLWTLLAGVIIGKLIKK